MNWAKAKTILIIVFLILNIFLLATIIYTNNNCHAYDYGRYAKEYLNSRNIKIETKIPSAPGNVGRIVYSKRNFDLDKIARYVFGRQLTQQKTDESVIIEDGSEKIELTDNELVVIDKASTKTDFFNDSEAFLKKVYEALKIIGINKENISLESVHESDNNKQFSFVLKYKNALLFDHILTADIDREGIITLSLPTKMVKRDNAPTEIISAYQVFVMAGLPEGSTIKAVDFGYSQLNEGEFYDTPVWRVVLDNGHLIFFDACTGQEL